MAMEKENDIRGQILDRMRRLCSRREYCTGDIHRKAMDIVMKKVDMADEAYACETASGIVEMLKKAGETGIYYVDSKLGERK